MREELLKRLDELVAKAPAILANRAQHSVWIQDESAAQAWMTSVVNVVQALCPRDSIFVSEIEELIEKQRKQPGVEPIAIKKMLGVLQSVGAEVNAGLVQRVEDVAFAEAFDDFLSHAEFFQKEQKTREAAVLVSVVLEDVVKRIAMKYGVPQSIRTLEPIIDDLVKANALTAIKAKRIKSYAGVRNAALHAEWDKLDAHDVGQAIVGVRELLDTHLSG